MKDAIFHYLATHHADALAFWHDASPAPAVTLEALCDVAYGLRLAGLSDRIDPRAPGQFADIVAASRLPGWPSTNGTEGTTPLSVHNCAYAFGTLNLLRGDHGDLYARAVGNRTLRTAELIDETTALPRFPAWLAHHHWRVSHWLGGVPSILWSTGQSALPEAAGIRQIAQSTIEATDRWLVAGDGFIKLHRFGPAQSLFRAAYRLRHDPDLGDIGGLAHIHWINHVAGRRYVAVERVLARASAIFQQWRPFMEGQPYCLDFDVVQLVRTASEQTGSLPGGVVDRAAELQGDLEAFFGSGLTAAYRLHKLPGALATYHECATICAADSTPFGPAEDIIRRAFWI